MSQEPLRAIVVDDEQPARERLRRLLAERAEVEVVAEADSGEAALERIAELHPDLVFLDVQMPGCSGLEVAASLPSPRPAIVFCTAYEEYAVDAFELHAVDYLLKPVQRARLEQALGRIRGAAPERVEAALGRLGPSTGWPARFLAKRGLRWLVVPAAEVLSFETDKGLTALCTAEHRCWVQPSLNDLEVRLDPRAWFRVSRGAIVRLDAVRELRPLDNGNGELLLLDGRPLEVSRRRLQELLERLSRG
ncbi:MAG TPA: response regulator [Candidatus Polarisedimenticolaceae bacterium]|nr:response regulator [Candidatus Polarisedimenticolaceae bacterium]